ncbi:MAG: glucosidase [Spirochaetes bacterium]|jgi:hypothetical protein|nr:glucosidase [Spirochaetota bacterium]
MAVSTETQRLADHESRKANWKNWGPYLSERAWGTVREDYSAGGTAWEYFPHDHARSRAYRWGEDGIGGVSDRHQHLCHAVALWNGADPILKERLFGLTGSEGNHGEDVKEYYYYLDSTPTHSYMKMLYKYPQRRFPYEDLVAENARRGSLEPEYELMDTGVFDEERYFDVFIEYANAGEDDLLCRITVVNRGPETAGCTVLPTLWYRNTWSWGYGAGPMGETPWPPEMSAAASATTTVTAEGAGVDAGETLSAVRASHPSPHTGTYHWYAAEADELIFTQNETNHALLFDDTGDGEKDAQLRGRKDAFHRYVVDGDGDARVLQPHGTKAAVVYRFDLAAGESRELRLRLSQTALDRPFDDFAGVFDARIAEADAFYAGVQADDLSGDERLVQRQAFAGLLWSKQFFYYNVEQWLDGDPGQPHPPAVRSTGRNSGWRHLMNFDIISMPDKWEYPWYASWDLAFHCVPIALVDPDFAKRQLVLMTREWYTHPNGQLPAYEWSFDDVNPPVHAWATWRVYKIARKVTGKADRAFLEDVFHKLLLNFTWWVSRKDTEGRNIFEGGFLGLDNISVFDRSTELPTGGHIHQSDGTAWMGFFSLMMLKMALELAEDNPTYQNIASKFFEHFLRIAEAMTADRREGPGLWNEEDGFFYDSLHLPDGQTIPLKVRSLVGLIPLIAVESLEPELLERMPVFARRMKWFYDNKVYLKEEGHLACTRTPGVGERRLLSLVNEDRLRSILTYMLDESEFLSPHGIRSVSKYHAEQPYSFDVGGESFGVSYQPAESESGMFGGNSNWRGPVWFPINFLLVEALQRFHHYHGDRFTVEHPRGSGREMTLDAVAAELSRRLTGIFKRGEDGRRPVFGGNERLQNDPQWCDYIPFHEYFHGENGAGIGASHQTGWTALVAKLLQQSL